MRMLKVSLICCMAIILIAGCASEKKMQKTAETAAEAASAAPAKPAATAEAPAAVAYEEVTLAVTGMT